MDKSRYKQNGAAATLKCITMDPYINTIPPFLAGLNKFYEKKVLQGIEPGTI